MSQTIELLGAVYSDVPAVELPKQGGGMAQFDDTTDANATASEIASGVSAYVNGTKVNGSATRRTSSDLTSSGATVTAPSGYYASNATKTITSGSATPPSTISSTGATISTETNTLVVSKSVTNTPTVSAGYVSSGTSGSTNVTLKATCNIRSSADLSQSGTTVTAPSGYYPSNATIEVGGGSSMVVATATKTLSAAASSISFTGLSGEPTSFAIVSTADLATGASPFKTASVVFDGTNVIGQTITNTNNAQVSYDDTNFSKSYSTGTLTVTGSTYFQANEYTLVYTYGGSAGNIATDDVQVGSGATSITFTGLSDEPDYFSCIFKSNFATSSGYQRVITVVYDGTDIYGLAMDSGAKYSDQHWSYTYNAGDLTITSQGTNAGGYFHQPGYYQLTYAVGGDQSLQTKTVTPTTSTQNVTADEGYDGLRKVIVNPIPAEYVIPTGNKAITSNGSNIDVAQYATVSVNVSGGGGGTVGTKNVTASNRPSSLSFTGLLGTPIAFFVKATFTMTSSSSTYYYVDSMRYNGTNTEGRCFQMGSTRQTLHVTSGYSYTYNNGTLTVSSTGNRTTSPGCFYNGSYELTYIY